MGKEFKASDELIGHIAQLIQLAILTGTDITDSLRGMSMIADENNHLYLDLDYHAAFEETLNSLAQVASELQEQEDDSFSLTDSSEN